MFAILLLASTVSLPLSTGHWDGVIHGPMDVVIAVDLTAKADGQLAGTFDNAAQNLHFLPLSNVAVDGTALTFEIKGHGGGTFRGTLDGPSMKGTFSMQDAELPFELTRSGEAKIEPVVKSAAVGKELEGKWSGTLDVNGTSLRVGLILSNGADGAASGSLISSEGVEIPITLIAQKGSSVTLDVKRIGGAYTGALQGTELTGTWTQGTFAAPVTFRRAPDAVERWAQAVGGRARVATINAIYREATIDIAGTRGTIKVWHTADGRYRKEEQVATFSSIETFDGNNGILKQGDAPPHAMAGVELQRARSSAFANTNAVFFALFPERRRGTVELEGDDSLVLKPEGGIDWHVALDPQTSLPKTMTHQQNGRTITVELSDYDVVDGFKLEREIHRSTGDPRFNAVIRFTKTVLNPQVDAAMFSIAQ
ncbi:MAG TPA: hypothetical protein VGX68_10955 [Thermoanaerobaculia bacterium]|jgi:hypothetical protein|nr:hypothetical protein [Thermoanaerobaculia bacterium]